ncbi:MAG: M14 metallopeptidase family protein [Verrucomicrobiota bacterium]
MLLALASPTFAARLTTPKEYFGFNLGDDYHLANYVQMTNYWGKLAKQSSRLKLTAIGETEEGRTMLMGIITSPANHRRLQKYQDISRKLALAEGLTEEQAQRLADEGKTIVWIDGGLHASETLGSQQLIEIVYKLVSGPDEETERILDNVIVLAVPANPDGIDLVADWYMREPDPKKRSLSGLPRLYQKYIGHDNNRDFYAVTQKETKAMNRVMYREWFPQIVYNHHQSGPAGTVMFAPPFRDPYNFNVDPLVMSGIDQLGSAMQSRFLAEGKPGVTVRSGARYSTWWNGGLRTTCYFHNMLGLLTETVGSPNPMRIPLVTNYLLPRGDMLAPIAPQEWHFRQSMDYSLTANLAVLDFAARHREQVLINIYRMGRNSIERANRDHWTASPRRIAEVEAKMKASAKAKSKSARVSTNELVRMLRLPEARDPRGYILPADQPDFLTATKMVNTLFETGIRVHRATADFQVAGKAYPAGSYVIKCAQAFRPHILDMFEPQDHPDDIPYPGAPPTRPYDMAGWTLAMQMGVKFDRILEGFDGPFEEIYGLLPPPPGVVANAAGASVFYLSARVNDSFRAVNQLLAVGQPVFRLKAPVNDNGVTHPAGTFIVTAKSLPMLPALAKQIGLRFRGAKEFPTEAVEVRPARIALWDRYGGSMPSGWTRWLLERFDFPFAVVYPPQLDAGNLREKFDVIVLVDGAIAAATNTTAQATQRADGGGDQPPQPAPEARASASEENIPAEYRGRRGSITTKKTVPELRKFLEAGGTILTIGSSTRLAKDLGLPVHDHLVETADNGKERPLPAEKFYVPGSLLRVKIDTEHPLAYGMEDSADVMFVRSPVFRLDSESDSDTVRRIAWFDSPAPLRSGWAWGQKHLENGIAILEAKVGEGRLVLFGPEIAFRATPHGTFKFLFNGLLLHGAPPAAAQTGQTD